MTNMTARKTQMNWPTLKGAIFGFGFVLLAAVVIYFYNLMILERPDGSAVDQSNYLAEQIENYLSERKTTDYLIYASPRGSSNQYFIYNIVRKDIQDDIVQFVKKRVKEENLKPTVLRFYAERLADSNEESPIRVDKIR
jgi:hypothetical protein